MVRRRRFAVLSSLAVAGGILVVAPSCGSGFLDGLSGGKSEAGNAAETGPADAGFDARTCSLVHVPPPPNVPDSELPAPIVIAMRAVRIDDATNVDASIPPAGGLDIDEACTCPEPDTCTPAPDAGRKCDGDGGTDNALGRMFSYLGSIFSDEFGPDFATRRIEKGAYGALFSIGGWNHEPNDPKVVVSVFLSHGTVDRVDGGSGGEPAFDGNDVWTVDPASVQNGESNVGVDCSKQIESCFPIHISREAYVSNGVLVAKMDIPLALSTSLGRISFEFEDVVLTARLTQDGSIWRADAEFVGRWPVDRVLGALARVPVNDKPLCDQTAFFEVARQEVCASVDVMADKNSDGKGRRCDAVSAAVRFGGVSAKLGPIFQPAQDPPICTQFVADCPK